MPSMSTCWTLAEPNLSYVKECSTPTLELPHLLLLTLAHYVTQMGNL